MLDLPMQSLSPDERRRAAGLFPVLGVDSPYVTQLYDYPSGDPVDMMASYQLPFHDDVDRATSIALDIFSIVFKLSGEALHLDVQEE